MNEPKKRGRPSKAELAARQAAVTEPVVNGDSGREPEDVMDEQRQKAQAYALRVWAGQSPTLVRKERIERVARALEGQGLSMEGVELP